MYSTVIFFAEFFMLIKFFQSKKSKLLLFLLLNIIHNGIQIIGDEMIANEST